MKKALNTLVLCVSIFLMACSNSSVEVNPEAVVTADMKIDGMVCAMGCAKVIQDEVGIAEGVTLSKVDFATGTAHFEFDENIISEEEIIAKIEALAEGQYKVSEYDDSEEEGEETEDVEETTESFGVLPSFEIPNLFTYVVRSL